MKKDETQLKICYNYYGEGDLDWRSRKRRIKKDAVKTAAGL